MNIQLACKKIKSIFNPFVYKEKNYFWKVKKSIKKYEMLKSMIKINKLFSVGYTAKKYPILIKYIFVSQSYNSFRIKFLFSVSKRNIKKAVERNKIKRRLREAMREQKPGLYDWIKSKEINLEIGVVYTGKELSDLDSISRNLEQSLTKMKKQISQDLKLKEKNSNT